MKQIKTIPCMAKLLPGSDHTDVKIVEGTVDLELFIKRMLTYRPTWLRWFYNVRGVIAKMLGLAHEELKHRGFADDIDLTPGGEATFFTSVEYAEGNYWLGIVQDRHLDAWVGILREPLEDSEDGTARFHVLTVVKHLHWTGPIYFSLIKPFHHLIVKRMALAGVREE